MDIVTLSNLSESAAKNDSRKSKKIALLVTELATKTNPGAQWKTQGNQEHRTQSSDTQTLPSGARENQPEAECHHQWHHLGTNMSLRWSKVPPLQQQNCQRLCQTLTTPARDTKQCKTVWDGPWAQALAPGSEPCELGPGPWAMRFRLRAVSKDRFPILLYYSLSRDPLLSCRMANLMSTSTGNVQCLKTDAF